jgi:hypothetical protein
MPYKEQLSALDGAGKLKWIINKGSLPKGLQLSPNGIFSGTPLAKGSFTFKVEVKDENNNTGSANFILSVN